MRLSALQHDLALEQSAHRQSELAVAELETPSRIVAAASGQLHMVRPANVIELPYVSLSVPLPDPEGDAGAGAADHGTSGDHGDDGATATTTTPATTATDGTATTTATSTP